jgi:hypothetical protein
MLCDGLDHHHATPKYLCAFLLQHTHILTVYQTQQSLYEKEL